MPDEIPIPERYKDLGALGSGAMAEVRRVWDQVLDRAVAMKILRERLATNKLARARFQKEARAIARLQHPSIVPIHEIGALPDGRPYYTMKEVVGRTLKDLIATASPDEGLTRRMLEALHRASEAVAFAHANGVMHRDLKPDNVMLGDYGEVMVVDWGLARIVSDADVRPLHGPGLASTADFTSAGTITGTPAYMPPEQAHGQAITPASDVYALGAILYEIVCGRPPFVGPTTWVVLLQLKSGPPRPLDEVRAEARRPPAPEDLRHLVETAMARAPEARYPDASRFAAELGAWLDGARRRERALARVAEADALAPRIEAWRRSAERDRAEAAHRLHGVLPYAPVDDKIAAWRLEDAASAADRAADRAELERIQTLRAAVAEDPHLVEAHQRLADYHLRRHAEAEAAGDRRAALEHETLLTHHDRGAHAAWLRGTGTLSLVTDPPAHATLYRTVEEDRRLVPRLHSAMQTPISNLELPRGSWLVVLQAPGFVETRYPVCLERGARWDGVAPGATQPTVVRLLPEGALGPDEVYIPAGPFVFGGDPDVHRPVPRQIRWTDPWIVARYPVTNRDYLAFLNALAAEGRIAEAMRHAPQERSANPTEAGIQIYRWDGRRFDIGTDKSGDRWELDGPVLMVDFVGASSYAAWKAARERLPWQLLPETVWEKAARGADGRLRPWGDHLEPTWCNMRDSKPRPLPSPVTDFPMDESVYGVRGVAGNCRQWCADTVRPQSDEWSAGTQHILRGGCWLDSPRGARVTVRDALAEHIRTDLGGFRLGRPVG